MLRRFSRMTLRARLLITVGALVAVALVLSGALVVGVTRANLVQLVDNDLLDARFADLNLPDVRPGPPNPGDLTGRRFALLVLDSNGNVFRSLPSGDAHSPDPLPAAPTAKSTFRQIVDWPSADGSLTYRAIALRDPQNFVYVFAAPLHDVDDAVGVVVRALMAVGLVVLLVSLIVGWFIIRRDLRPLQHVTETAERISAGDLSSRVGVRDDGSEVGRLGHAFDGMLDQIQAAFESQRAALVAKSAPRRNCASSSPTLPTSCARR
jgi:two-component system OmpR family sensor kinase